MQDRLFVYTLALVHLHRFAWNPNDRIFCAENLYVQGVILNDFSLKCDLHAFACNFTIFYLRNHINQIPHHANTLFAESCSWTKPLCILVCPFKCTHTHTHILTQMPETWRTAGIALHRPQSDWTQKTPSQKRKINSFETTKTKRKCVTSVCPIEQLRNYPLLNDHPHRPWSRSF